MGGKMFGTNGVRGIVGETMTPQFAEDLGIATAAWMGGTGTMALGRDARASGPELQAAFADGLHGGGVGTIDLGICPTPGIQWWTRQADVQGAAVITASHNPPEWNGIKIIEGDGMDASAETEGDIETAYAHPVAFSGIVGKQLGNADAASPYLEAVISLVDVATIQSAKFTVALDPGGGAGCVTAPRLLEALGVTVVPVSCDLDPNFSDRPSEPTEANAARCMAAVKQSAADFGVLQDGDADRSVFIDGEGKFIDGNVALAMVAGYEMTRAPEGNRIFCTTVATSSASVDVVESLGGRVEWTIVGSPPVARAMQTTGAPFGGEGNGGFLFARHQFGKDGLMAMARVLEIMATSKQNLASLVDAVPKYSFTQTKLDIPEHQKEAVLAKFKDELGGEAGILNIDDRDGVKCYLDDGWVLVRPSGTEPIFRVQAEAKGDAAADALSNRFKTLLASLLTT
jgi:phosphomannomutase/phosphoglucomutase